MLFAFLQVRRHPLTNSHGSGIQSEAAPGPVPERLRVLLQRRDGGPLLSVLQGHDQEETAAADGHAGLAHARAGGHGLPLHRRVLRDGGGCPGGAGAVVH